MAKKGTIAMTTPELSLIPAVPFTETWSPIHHKDVVLTILDTLADQGITPQATHHQVTQNGMDLFSTIVLEGEGRDRLLLGVRNSMQKNFALGMVGGHSVMVCSNMAFWGDFVEHRRHTSGLDLDSLRQFVIDAILRTIANGEHMRGWFRSLHAVALPAVERKLLTYEVLEQGIVAPSQFNALGIAYQEELSDNHFAGMESLAHFHGAVTRVLRGSSIGSVQTRTLALNRLLDARMTEPVIEVDRRAPMSARFAAF